MKFANPRDSEEVLIVAIGLVLAVLFVVGITNFLAPETIDEYSSSYSSHISESIKSINDKKVITLSDIKKNDEEATNKTIEEKMEEFPEFTYEQSEPIEETYVEQESFPIIDDPISVEPVEASGSDWTADNFQQAGVLEHNGTTYTWYSENVLPGDGLNELNSNGRSVSTEGYVIDGDGFIAVASSDYPIGTELWSPLGNLKVYDTGCESGTIDVYTSW